MSSSENTIRKNLTSLCDSSRLTYVVIEELAPAGPIEFLRPAERLYSPVKRAVGVLRRGEFEFADDG